MKFAGIRLERQDNQNSDSTGSNGKDQLFSYDGCGCAGGEVITIKGESVPGQSYNARRKQKIYLDILGRQYKTEIMNWDGTTVYMTTINTYNGRDQITQTRQYAGTTSSSTYQNVKMTYDGHGRIKIRHYPSEDAETETCLIYNPDDSIQQIIDPRGAITDFTYVNRGFVTEIAPPTNYTPLNSPAYMHIPDTPTVRFIYDAVGNRMEMNDGFGRVVYNYNQLSQLTTETRERMI